LTFPLFVNPYYFDTLQFEANIRRPTPYGKQSRFTTLIQAKYAITIKKKKIFILEYVFVINLNAAMMTLPFEANIDIRDKMWSCKDVTKEYGLGLDGGIDE